jgi:hypothetical protein
VWNGKQHDRDWFSAVVDLIIYPHDRYKNVGSQIYLPKFWIEQLSLSMMSTIDLFLDYIIIIILVIEKKPFLSHTPSYWLTVSRNVTLEKRESSRRLVWDGRQPGSELEDSRQPVRTWTRKLWKLQRWKPSPDDNRWRYSRLRRFYACCSELQSVWISDSSVVIWTPSVV